MFDEEPTILVVDDTEDNLDLLEFALKRKPIHLLKATSGKQCLEIAQEKTPELILLDIQMPEMDGFETLKRLRANPITAKIPVIFLTAQKKDVESIAKGLALGADQYLTKPIDTEELLVRTKMLIRIKKAEAELERTKADFMAMLVHDLRSPLIGVKSVVELVLDAPPGSPLSDDHVELLQSAHGSAKKLLELISDFLDVSRYEAGKITIEKSNVPVFHVVEPILIQLGLQLKQKNITVTTQYASGLPDVHVDPGKTEHVVMNFLSNAQKFTKNGGTIRINAEMDPENKDGKFVRVSITDNGVGIAPDEIPTLFSRYKQTSSAKTIKQKGTGLGLVICKLIVETQGGTVAVQSDPGKETTFSFTVPVV